MCSNCGRMHNGTRSETDILPLLVLQTGYELWNNSVCNYFTLIRSIAGLMCLMYNKYNAGTLSNTSTVSQYTTVSHIYVVPYSGPLPISRNLPIRRQFRDRRHIGSLHGYPSLLASSAYMALI
jgi:hypothetical protein